MKLIFFQSNKYMQEDFLEALRNNGHEVETITYVFNDYDKDNFFSRKLERKLKRTGYDAIISLNFYPVISDVCHACNVMYISWVYDSPAPTFYRFDKPTNRIFLFDRQETERLRKEGHDNIFYLPLAVNSNRLEKQLGIPSASQNYEYDISFVGALYDKYALDTYNLTDDPFSIGLMKGFCAAQTQFQNVDIIRPLIEKSGLQFDDKRYGDLMQDLEMEATHQERHTILNYLAEHFDIHLFTTDPIRYQTKINLHGAVNYEKRMPEVFRTSKINLNITLRTIKSAIPLRILDILGSGGFLITNPQPELFDFFEPDVDFVTYESKEELAEKAAFYLAHDDIRFRIMNSAYHKIKEAHNYDVRLKEMFSMI